MPYLFQKGEDTHDRGEQPITCWPNDVGDIEGSNGAQQDADTTAQGEINPACQNPCT
jgi:hypothetical protein